jgi:hypothetical protein
MSCRRVISCFILLAFAAASIGFPIPELVRSEDSANEVYPCKGHHCGCHDAQSCREHCCCGFRVAAKQEEPAHACCGKHDEPSSSQESQGITLAISALGCKGVSTIFIASGIDRQVDAADAVLVPDPPLFVAPTSDKCPVSFSLAPLIPPPRA